MIVPTWPLDGGAFLLSPVVQWSLYRSDAMYLLAEISAVAVAAKPELYLLIIGMGIVLRHSYKMYRDSQEANAKQTTDFMSMVEKMDEKGERRADTVAAIVEQVHEHQKAMIDRVTDHTLEINKLTSEAIARCSRAVESGERMISECVKVIEEMKK